jgi:hypothetical protein
LDLPYQQVARDVWLYGVFDGTRHVMLDQIQQRLRHTVRPENQSTTDYYRAPLRSMLDAARAGGVPLTPRPSGAITTLHALDGILDLGMLERVALLLEEVVRVIPSETWKLQSASFALAEAFAYLDAAIAVAELADHRRREGLGAGPCARTTGGVELDCVARFAIALLSSHALLIGARVGLGAGTSLDQAVLQDAAIEETVSGDRLREAVKASC